MENYPPSPYPDPSQHPQQAYQQTQPIYPPAQPGYPLAPASQKSHIGLWAALAALLILLGVGGGTLYYFMARSTPQRTLQAYCDAITTDDAQALYNTYSSEAQAHTSPIRLQQVLQVVTLLTGGVKTCVVDSSSIQESDPTASGAVTFTSSDDRSTGLTLHLIDENGQWRIENSIDIP